LGQTAEPAGEIAVLDQENIQSQEGCE